MIWSERSLSVLGKPLNERSFTKHVDDVQHHFHDSSIVEKAGSAESLRRPSTKSENDTGRKGEECLHLLVMVMVKNQVECNGIE